MFNKLILELAGDLSDISEQSTSLFHGVLMEKVNYEYGEILHISELKPFHQYLIKKEEKLFWIINTLNKEAYDNIIIPLLEEDFKSIKIKHKNLTLNIVSKSVSQILEDELIEKTYLSECGDYISINFLTPTAFKSGGKYIFYPDLRLIYQSLIKKYDSYADATKIGSKEVIEQLTENSQITFYSLRSTTFSIKGNINSFIGTITIKISGPQIMKNLVHLLFEFGEFSGVGIKCALGMGAINIKKRRKN